MREGAAPPQPWFGILCAGNEKPSVAMETAIPAPSVILCGKLLCRVGGGCGGPLPLCRVWECSRTGSGVGCGRGGAGDGESWERARAPRGGQGAVERGMILAMVTQARKAKSLQNTVSRAVWKGLGPCSYQAAGLTTSTAGFPTPLFLHGQMCRVIAI